MPFAACYHGFKQKIIKVFSQMYLLFEEKKVVSADVVHKTNPKPTITNHQRIVLY